MVGYDDFTKLDLRVGKILEAVNHPNADKLYCLKVDIGEKTVSLVAGIRPAYAPEELIGKLAIILVNLEPREIRGVVSEGMLLAAKSADTLSILTTQRDMLPGSIVK
ncbi:MAG: hypothetical protein ABH865_07535 [Candidatus Omnitrophota bacterium]|nr:hypothetical protein [Candidatus Omnitrophota bacterium]